MQHYVIKFVSDLQQVDGFLRVRSSNNIKQGSNDIDLVNNFYIMVKVMVFNATFNNISVIRGSQFYCWRNVHGENHRPAASH
jgi:hypothetical protein